MADVVERFRKQTAGPTARVVFYSDLKTCQRGSARIFQPHNASIRIIRGQDYG